MKERSKKVSFKLALVIEVDSWKKETGDMNHSRSGMSVAKADLAFGVEIILSEVSTEKAGEAGPRCSSVLP